jgi:transposase-like protein
MTIRRYSDQEEQNIVAAYKRGQRISKIVSEFDVPEASIYMILERHGAAPARMQRRVRLRADEKTVADLYQLMLDGEQERQTLEEENARLRQALKEARRQLARRDGGH